MNDVTAHAHSAHPTSCWAAYVATRYFFLAKGHNIVEILALSTQNSQVIKYIN